MIVRAEMDGSHITPLVRFSAWSTQGPSALAIDVDENLLYWVGGRDTSLQYIDLRYPQSEIVYHISFSNYLHNPLGLALDANYFYWTDDLLGNVIRASRNPDQQTVELIPYQYTPRGVNIYNPGDVQGKERIERNKNREYSYESAEKYSFFVRTIPPWSALPNHTVTSRSPTNQSLFVFACY